MEALKHAAERAKSGHGQLVAAMGEPGVGKSRLFFEFKAMAQSGCLVLEAYSVSHGEASAYLPVIDLLKGYFKVVTEDAANRRRARVRPAVDAYVLGMLHDRVFKKSDFFETREGVSELCRR
jgi:hypothetical protein